MASPSSQNPPAASPTASSNPSTAPSILSGNDALTSVVDDLLDSLQTKFASVSSEIYGKIEAMGRRLDEMEASLQRQQAQQQAAAKDKEGAIGAEKKS